MLFEVLAVVYPLHSSIPGSGWIAAALLTARCLFGVVVREYYCVASIVVIVVLKASAESLGTKCFLEILQQKGVCPVFLLTCQAHAQQPD